MCSLLQRLVGFITAFKHKNITKQQIDIYFLFPYIDFCLKCVFSKFSNKPCTELQVPLSLAKYFKSNHIDLIDWQTLVQYCRQKKRADGTLLVEWHLFKSSSKCTFLWTEPPFSSTSSVKVWLPKPFALWYFVLAQQLSVPAASCKICGLELTMEHISAPSLGIT